MLGQQLGESYQIVQLIGEGAMGKVYEARRLDTGRSVAVKVITGAVAEDPNLVARFEREAQAAAKVVTPHIVEVLDTGRRPETGEPYIVMELLAGESLQQLLDRLGPIAPELAARIGAQVCTGLHRAHSAGVVHRDIKPANLFLARVGGDERIVKLLDFGVAKLKMEQASATGNESLTQTGSVIGSPMFMSPEQARGLKSIDHRTDVWSLGIVLYGLLTGVTPHEGAAGLGDLIIAICAEEPPSVRERAPWVSEQLAEVVHGALRLAADERFSSAAAMLAALEPCLPSGAAISESMLVPLSAAERAAGQPTLSETLGGATVAMEPTPSIPTKTSPHRPGLAALPAKPGAAILVTDASTADPRTPLPVLGSAGLGDPLAGGGPPGALSPALAAAALEASSPLVKTTVSGPVRPAAPPAARPDARAEARPESSALAAGDARPASPAAGADGAPGGAEAVPSTSVGSARGSSLRRASAAVAVGALVGLGGIFAFNAIVPPSREAAADGGAASAPGRDGKPKAEPRAAPARSAALPGALAATAATASGAAADLASAAPSTGAGQIQAQLEVSPPFAGVFVDGHKAVVRQGKVELEGEVGSVHVVILLVKGSKTTIEVKLTPDGPDPPKVEAEVGPAGKGRLPRPDLPDDPL